VSGSPGLEQRCRDALRAYLAHGEESSLSAGYDLGREALERGYGVLDFIGVIHAALRSVVGEAATHRRNGAPGGIEAVERAEPFLIECLSPFEMAHRGAREANEALRRLDEVRESEIRRLAHELHDEAAQMLAAAHLTLDQIALEHEPARARLQKVHEQLREAAGQLRRIAHEMRPTMLDDLGLMPALGFLARGVAERSGLEICVDGTTDGRLSHAIEIALYRISQEALHNAARHGRASRVVLRVARQDDRLQLVVLDDGCGFDPASLRVPGREPGLGLRGIRERLGPLGGSFQIRSEPGAGTELRIEVPTGMGDHAPHPVG